LKRLKRIRRQTERNFETRLRGILIGKRWLVQKIAAKGLFDIMLGKDGYAFPVELKSRLTDYEKDQKEKQKRVCDTTGMGYALIRQLYKRTRRGFKIELSFYNLPQEVCEMLKSDLAEFM